MKRLFALMIAFSLLFAPLVIYHTNVLAAENLPLGEVSGIKLTLGDSVSFGKYTVTVTDIDSVTWSKAMIKVTGPQGTREFTIAENEIAYYPSPDNKLLGFSVVLWNAGGTPTILLTISSPLKNVFGTSKTMVKGQTITLPSNIKVTLLSVDNTSAEFRVTTTRGLTFTLKPGEGHGVSYRISSNVNDVFDYSNYAYVYLNATTKTKATVEFYMPKVPFTSIKITHKGETPQPPGPSPQPEKCNCVMYNGKLYVGESLTVKYTNTTYKFQIISVTSTKVGVRVYKGTKYETYVLSIGQSQKVPDTSIAFVVTSAEPNYQRANFKLLAPKDTQVSPPIREASISATISALPKKILVGDYLVVAIGVENKGRGDAYDLNVAAPIPNDFELVSSTQSWNIKTLPAFSKMPALIYVLKPTKVGTFQIGKATVRYYDDKSLLTGKEKITYSPTLKNITVYAIPSITVSAKAYNGTWSNYVTGKVGETLRLKFTVKASGSEPKYTFVKNATLNVYLGNSLDGPGEVKLGTLRAGETKSVMIDAKILKENLTNVRAVLSYVDPTGNEHELDLGNLLTVNSVPPQVIIKEVKVWPTPEELPGYVNQTLAEMGNNTSLAMEINDISKLYLPPERNTWKPLAILFIILTLIAGAMAYRYWNNAESCRKALERKRSKRPGGLPKKEDETSSVDTSKRGEQ